MIYLGYTKLYHILYMDLDIFNDGISLKFIKEFIIEITRWTYLGTFIVALTSILSIIIQG